MVCFSVRFVSLVIFIALVGEEIPSLMIEMESTMMRGAQAVEAPRGLMMGMDWRMAMRRKNTLANRLNC